MTTKENGRHCGHKATVETNEHAKNITLAYQPPGWFALSARARLGCRQTRCWKRGQRLVGTVDI